MEQGRSGFEPRACAPIRSDADLSPANGQVLFCLLQKRTCALQFTLARCTHWALPFWQFATSRHSLSDAQLRESPHPICSVHTSYLDLELDHDYNPNFDLD